MNNGKHIQVLLRFHIGTDDDLIEWLHSLDQLPYGAKSHAIKRMLRQGITGKGPPSSAVPDLYSLLPEIRVVVETAVAGALSHFHFTEDNHVEEDLDEEVEDLLNSLQNSLSLGN